ncbi:MAG TPA: hypothetical protein VF881_04135 [Polyangiaceae bacterium]
MERAIRSPKGFLWQGEDPPRPLVCRDVRGFPALAAASLDRPPTLPVRLVIVVPNVALQDWLARWAEDVGRARRSVAVTRQTDGRQVRFTGTLLAYGHGVDTAIRVERVEPEAGVARGQPVLKAR